MLNDHSHYPAYDPVEALRKQLLKDHTLLQFPDLGAGASFSAHRQRTVAALARHAAKSRKYGQLLFRVAKHFQPNTIIELGTSLGITSAYLAAAIPSGKLYTLEGAPAIAVAARKHLDQLSLNNAEVIEGHFDQVLPDLLRSCGTVDLAYIDGNHRKQPTLNYFRQFLDHIGPTAVMIFDDIHWSAEMEAAWLEIKADPRVMLTVDLFFLGLVFFNPLFRVKQHFRIRC